MNKWKPKWGNNIIMTLWYILQCIADLGLEPRALGCLDSRLLHYKGTGAKSMSQNCSLCDRILAQITSDNEGRNINYKVAFYFVTELSMYCVENLNSGCQSEPYDNDPTWNAVPYFENMWIVVFWVVTLCKTWKLLPTCPRNVSLSFSE
jgi:hypothetical protein